MTKKKYFLYDDDRFDYTGLVEPASEAAMIGYHAVSWNTSLTMTGWWQDRNVIGMTTADPLFSLGQGGNANDISQAVQIQQKWYAGQQLPWLWESGQGQQDKLAMAADVAVPVSWGTNLQQSNFLLRYEDVSAKLPAWGHGQRLWIQAFTFDNKHPARPMEIYRDPYTEGRDIVINVPIKAGTYSQFFDFSGSTSLQSTAFDDLRDFHFSQTRQQFTDLLAHVERTLGVDIQNESGWWSLLQVGYTSEMASLPATDSRSAAWGIGDHGAMQTAIMNLEVWDG